MINQENEIKSGLELAKQIINSPEYQKELDSLPFGIKKESKQKYMVSYVKNKLVEHGIKFLARREIIKQLDLSIETLYSKIEDFDNLEVLNLENHKDIDKLKTELKKEIYVQQTLVLMQKEGENDT
jgi:hypothetical protein